MSKIFWHRFGAWRSAMILAVVALFCAGGGATTAAVKSFTLGYSVAFLSTPFEAILANLTVNAGKKDGLKLLPVANANQQAGMQITDFHNLIAEGAHGIIVVPTDSKAIIPALDFAYSKHVPVVSIDIGPEGGKVAMVVRADNLKMGEDACQAVGRALHGKGKVLSLMGDQATNNGRDRTTGFNDCMKKNYPGIKVIQEPTYWQTDKATAAAQTIVTSTPDLNAIYMQSDSVMLAGVLNVLRSAGKLKKVGEPGHIYLVSIDGTAPSLQAIRQGLVDIVISQPLDLYAKYGLSYLEAAVDGKTFHTGPTDHGSHIVEYKGNLMDLLPAPIVTKANVDDPRLWGNKVKS